MSSISTPPRESLLVGVSRHTNEIRSYCAALAGWPRPVVVVGPTGTGKGVVADEIHRHLPPGTPYARLSAAKQRHNLLYSELFGYRRGAFTGANTDVRGLIDTLHGGVLFLDDFQDAGEELQSYLLDIADEKPLWALNAKRATKVNVRLIIGTQRPLADMHRQERLREDLLERLDGVRLELWPLCKHPEDIAPLAGHLLARLAEALRSPAPRLSDAALAELLKHDWPRNVRELERVLERATFQASLERSAPVTIEPRHLPAEIRRRAICEKRGRGVSVPDGLLAHTFRATGDARRTAEHFRISTRTVYRRLRAMGMRPSADGEELPLTH